MNIKDFKHFKLNEEINAISGHMAFREEKKMEYNSRELLYYTGYSVTDSSCCGIGGCLFTYIPGFIRKWQYKQSDEGMPVSEIEIIEDEKIKREITNTIINSETCVQVNFMDE